MMLRLVFLAAFVPLAASAAKLELELGVASTGVDIAPSWTARVGLDLFGHLTPSVRALAKSPMGDVQAWTLLAELRAHTRGRLQLTFGLSTGVGSAHLAAGSGEATARLRRTRPYLMGDAGVRVTLSDFWIGASLGRSTGFSEPMGMLSLGWAPLETRR